MKKEDILRFYGKYKLYIFPAVVGLVSLSLALLVIYPQTVKLLVNQQKMGEISQKAKFLEAKADKLGEYNPDDLKLKVDYAMISYPADKDFVSTMSLLQNIIAQSGFSIASLSLGSISAANEKASSYGFEVDVLGSGSKLIDLLANIENSYRLMRVTKVETSFERDSQIAASLSIEVLYSAPPSSFGSVDSPLAELSEKEEEALSKLATVSNIILEEQEMFKQSPRGKPNPFE